MKQRAAILLICAAGFLGGWEVTAAQTNAGFVQGLWYDRETVLVGEPVRIYAAIRNNTGGDLTGTVEFYVNGDRIERNNVAALNNRIVESWADWTPVYGTSTIRATLSRTELSSTASGTRRVTVVSALTEDVIFVDRDTDGDGIGNATDSDDDGDGISDSEERERGTDPLVYDEPEDNEDEEGDTSETDTENESEAEPNRETNDGPEGLEQFLSDSRAKDSLSSITNVINSSRERLDEYRQSRNQENGETPTASGGEQLVEEGATTTATSTELAVAGGGSFGEIQRSDPGEPPATFWERVIDFLVRNAENLYTFVLWLISLFLWHPVLVQLSLLFLILLFIYKLARKYGSRGGE